ncbi:hypothetical protein D5P88_15910 [Salmonella enterica subsp. enterica]|nr:hypothetical protein [Salmonella enterica subsp. enterica]
MSQVHSLFPIFRAGAHLAMEGRPLIFTGHDLQLTADAYNAAERPAPLVLGHPADDQPAMGQVRGMFVRGDTLYAQTVASESLASLVRAGRYRHVSACFYTPSTAGNPAPGAYYLKHVGFLGAQPPAVKGMAPPEFGEHAHGLYFCERCDCAAGFDSATEETPERQLLHSLALEYQRICPTLSYMEAVSRAGTVIF